MSLYLELKKLLTREFTILEVLKSVFIFILIGCCFFLMYNQYLLVDHFTQLQIENESIKNELIMLRNQLATLKIDQVRDYATLTTSIDPAVLAANHEMQKFYIITGLGVVAVLGLLGGGFYYYWGFSFWKFVPAVFGKIPYFGKFLLPVKKFCILDSTHQINWLVEIVNDKVCFIYVESLTNLGTKIPATVYITELLKSSGVGDGGGTASVVTDIALSTTAAATNAAPVVNAGVGLFL